MSKVYYDRTGRRRVAKHPVPVDQHGVLAGVGFRCRKCKTDRWFPVALAAKGAPVCEVHDLRMRPTDVKRAPLLPWRPLWQSQSQRLKPVWVGASVATAGVVAHAGHAGVFPALAALPAGVVAGGVVRRRLIGRAVAGDPVLAGKVRDGADPVGLLGRRDVETVGRWARTVGVCTAGGCLWTVLAATAGMDPATLGGKISLTVLAASWLYPAGTWWHRLRGQRREVSTAPDGTPGPDSVTVDPFEVQVVSTWATRVGAPNAVLPGTRLIRFGYIRGGWTAVVVSDTPGSVDPDRWRYAVGRVAAAFQCGVVDVALELDTGDASRATVRVQKENPLCEVTPWPGPADTWDPVKGVSWVGRFGDNARALYRWWNSGGPWHDLISGATGSGKSEFVNALILTGLHSGGLVLDRVIDPQSGQSFGDLQDHVDWFAPDITEARLLLLDTVKEMRRRNRMYSLRRQKTWKPCLAEPLIVVTIDEAHEVLKDPICLALVEKLAKMARKCGIKLRIITQVPVVTEIGNSTPIKDALLAGNIVVFRTGSAVSSQVSIGPVLPVDPHKLPPEWPKGSPGEGQTTAGLGFMSGASRREVPWRSFFTGDDIKAWLFTDGALCISPGVPSAEMVAESGVLWGDRKARVEAFFTAPSDDSDILPDGLVEALIVSASAGASTALRRMVAPTPAADGDSEDGTARVEVLRVAVRNCDDQGRITKDTVADKARGKDRKPLKTRTLSDALTRLVADGTLLRVKNGLYEVTDRARVKVGAEAMATVNAVLGPDPADEAEAVAAP